MMGLGYFMLGTLFGGISVALAIALFMRAIAKTDDGAYAQKAFTSTHMIGWAAFGMAAGIVVCATAVGVFLYWLAP